MQLAIMQPYFFPYIGYWQLINAVDKFVIYDDVNFIKRGFVNRNKILMGDKEVFMNLPIEKASQNKLINELNLSKDVIYHKEKLLKTIEVCYKKSPYFEEVFSVLKEIIHNKESNLARYLEYSILSICDFLSINTEIVSSSDIKKNNNLKGQDKILDICKVLEVKKYVNSIGGKALYSTEDFKLNGIKLSFLKTSNVEYKQMKSGFIPNLSIIDVMMFNSKMETKNILTKYSLIEKVGEENK